MSLHSSLRSDGARINRNERPDHAGTTARINRNTHVDGVDALRMLADQGRPAVILSDLTMPRMDGWALAQALLENGATSGIPLCVMTALPSGHDIPSNAIALLRKPVVPERLLALLRRCARTASA